MTVTTNVDESDDPLCSARRWVVRLRSGDVSQQDLDALARWRAESPANRKAFALANAQWDLLRSAALNIVANQATAHTSREVYAMRALTRRAWIGGAMAASVGGAVYLAVRPPLELWPSLAELGADYRTDVGERRQIAFADTTSVEMNTRTSLVSAEGEGNARWIDLLGGEIAVSTAPGASAPARPFVVMAGNGRTSATQATFDLRRDADNVSVACLDGEVKIECGSQTVTLAARQRIAYSPHGLGDLTSTEGRVVGAWRQGLLVFDNQPLAEVIPEINRYRRGRIVLTNERSGRLLLDATFRLDRIDEVVPKIAHLFGLHLRTLPGGLAFLS
ncbi:FecR domain-containing protein [Rhodopseudomonas sp. P2A-2r]|uniref:FecR family protein n=1 Tax=Rhodopseudomonas sp. P2A-2r TaxID=2991972 RepID=UPI00223482ED|nr:FecR domain-containing protein [Rhodopseudomonas sp. P2A-2r]UZE52065.1 FecR domain-containing protein [Rhodopseudomonas sp. P2A-2r]